MHYSDGTPAQVGDIVRGRGYNLPYDIVGPVAKLLPETGEACNIRVSTVTTRITPDDYCGSVCTPGSRVFEIYEEAGACKAFELLSRVGWEQSRSEKLVWIPLADNYPTAYIERMTLLSR